MEPGFEKVEDGLPERTSDQLSGSTSLGSGSTSLPVLNAPGSARESAGESGNSQGDASVCARCAAMGNSCCHSPEGIPLAPSTAGDIQRISEHTGLDPAEFVVSRVVEDEEREAWIADDPAADAWITAENLLRSVRIVDGRCFFLGSEGCTLPRSIRPIECLRFPFAKRNGHLVADPAGSCLACDESANLEELMKSLKVDSQELNRLERRLRRAAFRQKRERKRRG